MIEVIAVGGLATVQDAGRPGHMHEGVPEGGALVPQMLARANVAALNSPGDASIEAFGAITMVARAALVIATDDGETHALRDGEKLTVARAPTTRVRYIAVRGGIDVPRVLGGRGTLLVASLGGHEGRPLRKGDVLGVRDSPAHVGTVPPMVNRDGPVRVVLGPDLERFDVRTVELFLASSFFIDAQSDRVGTRLAGPRLACARDPIVVSSPMVRGAVQLPSSGELIVLGPDHPTTGGYPVIATVVRADQGSLAARPIGSLVRFATRSVPIAS